MFYPEEIVEEIRMKNDIVDIVSGYVKLQKKGSNYFGLCPFHNEKSPSFSVSPNKQMYYCFGCGAGGNVITFIMEYENYTFPEAITMLADRAGVTLPKQEDSREAREQADLRSTLLEINKLAANYFYYKLNHTGGEAGYEYFKKRELSDETIKKFGLGFAGKTNNDLYLFLKSKKYSDELLKQSGLVTIDEKGGHDKFWNRVIFPILDINNRVIGFGGRVMGQGEPKYLNSPETKLFDKSRNLYGLNYARISRKNFMLICEGYMDVIAMHQAGFTNAVASLGTAFTTGHASLLKRYTDTVILTYDSDTAGIKAALRAIPILKEVGISIKVLNMKPYKDPDEFIKNLGSEEFQKRIDDAKNSFLFEIDIIKENYRLDDPEQKTAFYKKAAEKLLEFTEPLERDNYIQAVSREHYINYEDLKKLVNMLGNRIQPSSYKNERELVRKSGNIKEDGNRRSQRLLLTWLIDNPKLYDKIKEIITPKDFDENLYRQVAETVWEELKSGTVNAAGILNNYINDDEQYKEVVKLFNTDINVKLNDEEWKKAFSETVFKIKKNSLDMAGRKATDASELQEIIKEQAALKTFNIIFD